jgi:hypothetical protein
MATLNDVVCEKKLEVFELPEWEPRQPVRELYVTPELLDRADDWIALHQVKVRNRTLFEHLLQAFCDFRCERHYHAGDLRRMMPTSKGVWSMHAPGLRIYGWCPRKHAFVAVTFATEKQTKSDKRLNDEMRKCVETFIKKNKLGATVLRGDINENFPYED